MDWEGCMWAVVIWAEEKGYAVDIDSDDNCMDAGAKVMELKADNLDLENKTYIALHEAGHILIHQSPGSMKLLPAHRREDKNLTKEEKVLVILEEAEAWKRGHRLGQRLKIPIDDVKWEIEQADALTKYMEWALRENE